MVDTYRSRDSKQNKFSSGILRGVIQSSDWKSQDITTTDSSIDLELWEGVEGKCHYGVVFVTNGHLGLLRSKPDANNDCANQSATQNGTLYLGSNDNLGICQEGSCYQDNQGAISVWISVRQH